MEGSQTLLEIVHELIEKGYAVDINLLDNLINKNFCELLNPEDFEIEEVRIAEDETNTSHFLLVLAISSEKYNIKGIVLSALEMSKTPSFFMRIKKLVRKSV